MGHRISCASLQGHVLMGRNAYRWTPPKVVIFKSKVYRSEMLVSKTDQSGILSLRCKRGSRSFCIPAPLSLQPPAFVPRHLLGTMKTRKHRLDNTLGFGEQALELGFTTVTLKTAVCLMKNPTSQDCIPSSVLWPRY